MTKTISKQDLIEEAIDKHSGTTIGSELNALISLNARWVFSNWKPNRFIIEFANSLGLNFNKYPTDKRDRLYIDVAARILEYTYPKNRSYWKLQDERYIKQVKNSAWIKYNSSNKLFFK